MVAITKENTMLTYSLEVNPSEITSFEIRPDSEWWYDIIDHVVITLNIETTKNHTEALRILSLVVAAHITHSFEYIGVNSQLITDSVCKQILKEKDSLYDLEAEHLLTRITCMILLHQGTKQVAIT